MSEQKKKLTPPRPKAETMQVEPHPKTKVKKVIAVVSGKGGVGKSSVTAMSAVWARRNGYQTGILDADQPATSITGIKVMSMNLLMKQEDAPVIWRSPVITGALKQFWQEVIWGNVDYMFVDMPPGTGDVPLTVFQSLPIAGIIIVTTPQDLVSMIVKKALGMAKLMNVPILGLVENMSYITCPHCGEQIHLFGSGKIDEIAQKEGLPVIARIPIDPEMTAACDNGKVEYVDVSVMDGLAEVLPPIE